MRKRGYQDKELIRILQQKAEELGRSPHMCDMKEPSYRTYCNRFGSWTNALKAAGLGISTKSKKYSNEELILLLQQKAKEIGRTPHVYDMKKPSYETFCNRFGSWADALKAAGLDISTKGKKYSNEELILILQQKAKELGRTPHEYDMKKPSYETYCNRFGSWADALKAAGLYPSRGYSNEELILILQQKAEELGRTPRTRDMKRPSASTFYDAFGSWNNALRSAGLKTNSRRKYNDKELILILQQKAKELGRTPRIYDMKKPSYGTYCNRFGSWVDALKAAGLYPSRRYSNEELILLLQQKAKELGRTLHVYDMKKPSYRTYCRIFGTWNKALEAAGLKS